MGNQSLGALKETENTLPRSNGDLSDEELSRLAAERREKRVEACTAEYNQAVEAILKVHHCRLRVGMTFWSDGVVEPAVQIVADG